MFGRVASWLANEVVTKLLGRSQTFQRAAVRTHERVQALNQKRLESASNFAQSEAAAKVTETAQTFSRFKDTFMRELRQETEKVRRSQ
eukprot:m.288311 g.288311  ORF g.288311 m.288311 type:complete len:88 (-) comp11946_c0_seq1:240-503(-)